MDNLQNNSLEELRAEITRREEARRAEARAARILKNRKILQYREVLLPLLQHSRTSCFDDDPVNGAMDAESGRFYPRCFKCALINLSDSDVVLSDVEIDIAVGIHLVKE